MVTVHNLFPLRYQIEIFSSISIFWHYVILILTYLWNHGAWPVTWCSEQGGSIIGYWSRTVTGSWLSEMCHFHGISLVQFSRSVVFDSLRPHGLQHARPPCPSPTPRACLNSCPLNRWCHPTISSCVVPFSSCLQSFPKSESFLMSQFFTSCGQSIGASGFSNSPSNEYSGLISFSIDCFDLIAVQGTLKSLL